MDPEKFNNTGSSRRILASGIIPRFANRIGLMHNTVAAIALLALLLAGCGQMGPLYDPAEKPPGKSATAPTTANPAITP